MNKYTPFINLGPGDSIRAELEHYGWEQRDLAEIMDRSDKNISQIITNKVPITYETAALLGKTFNQSVEFWLTLDARYRERLQEDAKIKDTEARALIYRYTPVRALRLIGVLPTDQSQLHKSVMTFWNIKELDFGFLDQRVAACFRKSNAYNGFNPYNALAWLQVVKNNVQKRTISHKYNKKSLEDLVQAIPKYSTMPNGILKFIQKLERCGVLFDYAQHLPQTYTDGAAFLLNKTPVIAYTARFDRDDNFWFTIAHEIGHILLHLGKQKTFIDSMDHLEETQEEKEANVFAEEALHSNAILKACDSFRRPSSKRIKMVASELKLTPSIVCGCLQHHAKASWNSFHELKQPVRDILAKHTL